MKKEKQNLERKIELTRKKLQAYPEGKLLCTKNGKYSKWYLSDGKKKTYIPKEQKEFAETMAVKKYLSDQLEDLLQEKKAMGFYLRHHRTGPGLAEQELAKNPEYSKLLSNKFETFSQELKEWAEESYIKNEKYPEELKFHTSSGHIVRSKTEVLIASVLHKYGIPFRYECQYMIGDVELFPDFMIKHPKTGKIILWEHFGAMDKERYRKRTLNKLNLYISHGIIPMIHLITTYETNDTPLDISTIEKIVEEFFL